MIAIVIPMVGPEEMRVTSLIWYKKLYDEVLEGDLLADVETEKVTLAIESPVNGTLVEKTIAGDQSAMTGQTIGYIKPYR